MPFDDTQNTDYFLFPFACPVCGEMEPVPIVDMGKTVQCPACGEWNTLEPTGRCFDGLNLKQKQAVSAFEGMIRLVAGAGTGKTRVLIHRLAHLIMDVGIPQQDILSVTFTNKAANVMKTRARQLLGENVASRICTFHGFCYELLKEDIRLVGFPPSFDVMDADDQRQIIVEILKELNIGVREYAPKKAADDICVFKYKNRHFVPYLISADSTPFLPQDGMDPVPTAEQLKIAVFNEYLKKQRSYFRLDFDDLILFAVYILQTFADCKKKWNDRIKYIQVDEFQDVDKIQFELLGLLLGDSNNLFVVGDPDQNIYTWRGACQEIIMGMKSFAAGRNVPFLDLVLDDNYRSYQGILDVSNNMIRHNANRIKKSLTAVRKDVGAAQRPVFYHGKNNVDEADWVVRNIRQLHERNGCPYSDIAILLRSLHTSRVLEQEFRKREIPYIIVNGVAFYQRKEVRDALAYLRLIVGNDNLSFLRIVNSPARGFGDVKIAALKDFSQKHRCTLFEALQQNVANHQFSFHGRPKSGDFNGETVTYTPMTTEGFVSMILNFRKGIADLSVSKILSGVLEQSGYEACLLADGEEERVANLQELLKSVEVRERECDGHLNVREYLNELAMYSEKSVSDADSTLKMMTIHVAKGAEFPIVFVPFLNESVLPSVRAETPEEIEEERRVAYVALTRAENRLFLSESGGYAECEGLAPSRFLVEMDPDCLNCANTRLPEHFWEDQKSRWLEPVTRQIPTKISPGMRVNNLFFGMGVVAKVEGTTALVNFSGNRWRRVQVSSLKPATAETFPQRERKSSVEDFAKMWKHNLPE